MSAYGITSSQWVKKNLIYGHHWSKKLLKNLESLLFLVYYLYNADGMEPLGDKPSVDARMTMLRSRKCENDTRRVTMGMTDPMNKLTL